MASLLVIMVTQVLTKFTTKNYIYIGQALVNGSCTSNSTGQIMFILFLNMYESKKTYGAKLKCGALMEKNSFKNKFDVKIKFSLK